MDEQYDVTVLGTGLRECILSGLLSVDGPKVLRMDRNDYYGGAAASLNLNQLWQKFRSREKPPAFWGSGKDYNVDVVPKFMMANGALVRVLISHGCHEVPIFQGCGWQPRTQAGKIYKVPSNDAEALKSPLIGIFEMRRAQNVDCMTTPSTLWAIHRHCIEMTDSCLSQLWTLFRE